MKYSNSVEIQYNKFINNTICGRQLNEYQLDVIKRYMQYSFEAGYAQGFVDNMKK